MREDTVVGAVLGLALALVPAAGSAQVRQMRVAGVERRYLVHEPSDPGRMPDALLIVLHGGGGTAAGTAAHTGFDQLADSRRFIVVYPAAIDRRWRDGRPGAEGDDDVTFLRALSDTLRRRYAIPDRVFAAGISNGAMMAYRLACEAPGAVAAIGVVAGGMRAGLAGGCAGTDALPVVVFHGTEDRLVPFDGGRGTLGVSAALAHWAARARCDAPGDPVITDRVRDGTVVAHVRYRGCAVPVELYTIRGGGHTWPGGPGVRARAFGRTTREIAATEVLWRFFDRALPAGRSVP